MHSTIHWIPVTHELPDDEITVLIADSEADITLGFHDGESGWRYCDGGRVTAPILHWADLPSPPST